MKNSTMRLTPAALAAAAKGDLHNAMLAATPGGIEAQEKTGQMLLVASTDMPKELAPDKAAFERLGFTFGNDIDDLFVKATLPTGWKREASDHAMHSYILDERGRRRVGIFYKAAFYDRKADAHLIARYQIETLYPDLDPSAACEDGWVRLVIKDGGTEIHRLEPHKRQDWNAGDERRAEAVKWLDEHFPNRADPVACWQSD